MARKKIGTMGHASIYRDTEWGEWIVEIRHGDVKNTYHTDNKQDALQTAAAMSARWEELNGPRKPKNTARKNPNVGTVRAFLAVLNHELTRYDARLSARQPNMYHLGHFLGASERVQAKVKSVLDKDTPEALSKLALAMDDCFSPSFVPVTRTLKQMTAYLESGTLPRTK